MSGPTAQDLRRALDPRSLTEASELLGRSPSLLQATIGRGAPNDDPHARDILRVRLITGVPILTDDFMRDVFPDGPLSVIRALIPTDCPGWPPFDLVGLEELLIEGGVCGAEDAPGIVEGLRAREWAILERAAVWGPSVVLDTVRWVLR